MSQPQELLSESLQPHSLPPDPEQAQHIQAAKEISTKSTADSSQSKADESLVLPRIPQLDNRKPFQQRQRSKSTVATSIRLQKCSSSLSTVSENAVDSLTAQWSTSAGFEGELGLNKVPQRWPIPSTHWSPAPQAKLRCGDMTRSTQDGNRQAVEPQSQAAGGVAGMTVANLLTSPTGPCAAASKLHPAESAQGYDPTMNCQDRTSPAMQQPPSYEGHSSRPATPTRSGSISRHSIGGSVAASNDATVDSPAYQYASVQQILEGRENIEYILDIREQPKQSRMCGVGEKADRRPIDPAPIVQLRVVVHPPSKQSSKAKFGAEGKSERQARYAGDRNVSYVLSGESVITQSGKGWEDRSWYLENPYYFMCAMLADAERDEELHLLSDGKTRYTTGSCVSCLYHLKDIDGSHQGFFVFPDLSIRIEGRYRLKLCLFETIGNEVHHCKSIYTSPFVVYTAKRFPGMEESTPLSRSFADQGLKVRVRKNPRGRRGKRERSSGPISVPASDDEVSFRQERQRKDDRVSDAQLKRMRSTSWLSSGSTEGSAPSGLPIAAPAHLGTYSGHSSPTSTMPDDDWSARKFPSRQSKYQFQHGQYPEHHQQPLPRHQSYSGKAHMERPPLGTPMYDKSGSSPDLAFGERESGWTSSVPMLPPPGRLSQSPQVDSGSMRSSMSDPRTRPQSPSYGHLPPPSLDSSQELLASRQRSSSTASSYAARPWQSRTLAVAESKRPPFGVDGPGPVGSALSRAPTYPSGLASRGQERRHTLVDGDHSRPRMVDGSSQPHLQGPLSQSPGLYAAAAGSRDHFQHTRERSMSDPRRTLAPLSASRAHQRAPFGLHGSSQGARVTLPPLVSPAGQRPGSSGLGSSSPLLPPRSGETGSVADNQQGSPAYMLPPPGGAGYSASAKAAEGDFHWRSPEGHGGGGGGRQAQEQQLLHDHQQQQHHPYHQQQQHSYQRSPGQYRRPS